MDELIVYGAGQEECHVSMSEGVSGGGRALARLLEKFPFLTTRPWDAEGGDEKPSGCLLMGPSGLTFAIVDSEDTVMAQAENINKIGKMFYELATKEDEE